MSQQQMIKAFDRAAQHYDQAALLQREVGDHLLQQLDWIKLRPQWMVNLGSGTGLQAKQMVRRYPDAHYAAFDISWMMLDYARCHRSLGNHPTSYVCAAAQMLPFAHDSFDLVFSNLMLQWCEDLSPVFSEVFRILKPGGLFIFSTLGPDTLKELHGSWLQAEPHARLHTFIDMHDVGDALLESGLSDPVMHREMLSLQYRQASELFLDLRHLGAKNKFQQERSGLITRRVWQTFLKAYEAYRDDQGWLPASYEVIYGHAWCCAEDPHDCQGGREADEVRVAVPRFKSGYSR